MQEVMKRSIKEIGKKCARKVARNQERKYPRKIARNQSSMYANNVAWNQAKKYERGRKEIGKKEQMQKKYQLTRK